MAENKSPPRQPAEREAAPSAPGSAAPARGATAEELKGISAVPKEEDGHGDSAGALPSATPGDEVDPGAG